MSTVKNISLPNSTISIDLSLSALHFWFGFNISCASVSSILIILLLVVIFRTESLRHGSGLLIAHLLFVNFLICGFTQPTYLIGIFLKVNNPQEPIHLNCTAFMYIHLSLFRTECFASLSMAINRFFAIVLPHYYHWMMKKSTVIAIIVMSWVCGFLIYSPTIFGIGQTYGKFPPFYSCGSRSNGDSVLPHLAVFGTYIPLGTLGFLYLVIALSILCNRDASRNQRMQKRITIAKMLCSSFVFYVCCFVPMTVGASFFPLVVFRRPEVLMWLVALQMLGYSGHPVVFLTLNKDYRKACRNLFGKAHIGPQKTLSRTHPSRGETAI
ncbi:red-sensitive opsin-like [Paramacrobiotus metropolitanus]|uniref:red-sensitive opsin-like n=1 Tax=Paramacrobiotus metropolitanus TaxID=2943436 RepID=UPI002445A5C9|nr:red-sensitive opsin-like [Paramacrobiotus metropolitanus]